VTETGGDFAAMNLLKGMGMRFVFLSFAIGLACAAPPKKADAPPATAGVTAAPAPGGRIKDSVPERRAGLNAADRDLQQGAVEERFGFEEARARREAAKRADAGASAPVEPGLGANGSFIQSPRQ